MDTKSKNLNETLKPIMDLSEINTLTICPEKYKGLLEYVANQCTCKNCDGNINNQKTRDRSQSEDKKPKRTKPRAEICKLKGTIVQWRITLENDLDDNCVIVNHEGFRGSDIEVSEIKKTATTETIRSGSVKDEKGEDVE
ncbi:uncharacterized protein LOC109606165 [Aethina tumida]|uniref:uncharacterized protein LOC109606165 n=1 Tax=Aethina tumida TaxID=116153 RepID=UPI0021490D5B|nr:uncharacterized protein LOC109606165 [Aethina tumida]